MLRNCKILCNVIMVGMYLTLIPLGLWLGVTFLWSHDPSLIPSLFVCGTVLVCVVLLTFVCWFYSHETHRALKQAKQAEATLEEQVQKRTDELRQAQLDEMRELYRFAELGQMGVTLLHDLANHLTALSLEIEGLQNSQQSKDIEQARQITQYLEEVVENTRIRLQGGAKQEHFDVAENLNHVVAFLRYKAAEAQVSIDWQPPVPHAKLTGDPASLCHVVAILANNAIDAYAGLKSKYDRRVSIRVHHDTKHVAIKVSDQGKGISKQGRKHLFKPFSTTKASGMGLGLFIAKQTVETEFGGTLELNPWSKQTEFIITLPLKQQKILAKAL